MTTHEQHHRATQQRKETALDIEPVAPGRWIAHLPDGLDLPLSAELPDHRPRVRDLDLAAWLGFERPRNIRNLVKRMVAEGKLRGVEVCSTVKQTPGGRPGQEFHLTREQALLVATQSETPRAWELTELMVQVFDAVIDRQRTPAAAPSAPPMDTAMAHAIAQALAVVPQLAAQLTDLRAEVALLRADVSTGVVGPAVAMAEVVLPLRRIAALRATTRPALRSERRRAENRLRSILGHHGPGSSWAMLPRRLLDVAQRQLRLWLDGAIGAHAANLRASQGRLPLPFTTN